MTLMQLLMELRRRQLILISASEIWPSPLLTCKIRSAVRRHRKFLATLLHLADARVCASPMWHRRYWCYRQGRYICEMCARLSEEMEVA